jgi:hypothetical protein
MRHQPVARIEIVPSSTLKAAFKLYFRDRSRTLRQELTLFLARLAELKNATFWPKAKSSLAPPGQ